MPTGYTADLESRKYDVKSWLKENVIRAMGVCLALRDDGPLTVEAIKAKLQKEESEVSYSAKKLAKAQSGLIEFKSLNPKALQELFSKEKAEALKKFEERSKEYEKKKAAHLKSIEETNTLLNKAKKEFQGEVIVNTLKFALEQLNQAFDWDYGHGPYREKILDQNFEQWNLSKREAFLRDLEYHGKEMAKEEKRNFARLTEYEKFVNWVDSN